MEAERAEAAATARYMQAKTKAGLQSAGLAVVNIVKGRKGQAMAFAPDDLDLATSQMREEYAKVGPAEARKAEEARLAAVKASAASRILRLALTRTRTRTVTRTRTALPEPPEPEPPQP